MIHYLKDLLVLEIVVVPVSFEGFRTFSNWINYPERLG